MQSNFKKIFGAALVALVPTSAMASSHREAPSISNDPSADSTDLYAWVEPGAHSKLFVLANYIPLEEPAGGPNFNQLSEDVRYEIHIYKGDNINDDFLTYRIEFETADFPTASQNDPASNIFSGVNFFSQIAGGGQTYKVKKIAQNGQSTTIASGIKPAPANIGPDTNAIAYGIAANGYAAFADTFIKNTTDGGRVFVGPRDDGFYVDLGGVFDLANIVPPPGSGGRGGRANPVDNVAGYNTHTIALEIPIANVFAGGAPTTSSNNSTIGVWTSASRRKVTVLKNNGKQDHDGPFVQVSRLGLPLINEAVIGLQNKDKWNASEPKDEVRLFAGYYNNPVIVRDAEAVGIYAALGVPQATVDGLKTGRAGGILDIVSLTGGGINLTNKTDVLRLDCSKDSAFPNGRSLQGAAQANQENGDVTDILLSVLLVGAGSGVSDRAQHNDVNFLSTFPFLATPHEGFGDGHGKDAQ